MMILRGVNVFPTQIEEQLLTIETLAPHFQIELSRQGARDEMRVLCEAMPGAEAQVRDAQMALVHKIKTVVGVTVRVEIGAPGSVARSQGKAVRIVDTRPKD